MVLHRITRKPSQQNLLILSLWPLHWGRFRLLQAKVLPWLKWSFSLRRCGLACICRASYAAVLICALPCCLVMQHTVPHLLWQALPSLLRYLLSWSLLCAGSCYVLLCPGLKLKLLAHPAMLACCMMVVLLFAKLLFIPHTSYRPSLPHKHNHHHMQPARLATHRLNILLNPFQSIFSAWFCFYYSLIPNLSCVVGHPGFRRAVRAVGSCAVAQILQPCPAASSQQASVCCAHTAGPAQGTGNHGF